MSLHRFVINLCCSIVAMNALSVGFGSDAPVSVRARWVLGSKTRQRVDAGKPCWAFIYIQVREGKSRAPGAGGVLALAVVRQGVREEGTAGWSVGNTENRIKPDLYSCVKCCT